MHSLRHNATRVFRALLTDQPNTAAKVAFAWKMAAGQALSRASHTDWSPDGTLRVRARDDVWLKEIRRAKPIIFDRLAALLGPGVVKTIVTE